MAESAPTLTLMQKVMKHKYVIGGALLLLVVGGLWWKYKCSGCCDSNSDNKTGTSMNNGNSNSNAAPANNGKEENPYTTNSSGELVPNANQANAATNANPEEQA